MSGLNLPVPRRLVDECAEALFEAERRAGTAVLVDAMRQVTDDPGFEARSRQVRDDGCAGALALLRTLGRPEWLELADRIQSDRATAPAVEPCPVPTTGGIR